MANCKRRDAALVPLNEGLQPGFSPEPKPGRVSFNVKLARIIHEDARTRDERLVVAL